MDDTSAPWRALEDAGPSGHVGAAVPAGGALPPSARVPRNLVTLATLGGAGLLAVLAVVLVVDGGHGAVSIDGTPLGSGSTGGVGVAASVAAERLVVDVQGAVVRPGIVELPPGSRVGDAIGAAGGYSPRVAADRVGTSLNLAALVRDGDQIVVPSRDDPPGGPIASTGSGGAAGGPIDLNHATAAELDGLPGIGPATATKIIAAREEQPFSAVEDLQTRKIVGASAFSKIKDLVTVR
jgi:competence protein ComEA